MDKSVFLNYISNAKYITNNYRKDVNLKSYHV